MTTHTRARGLLAALTGLLLTTATAHAAGRGVTFRLGRGGQPARRLSMSLFDEWSCIVGLSTNRLLFYERGAGRAKLCRRDGEGKLRTLDEYRNWRPDWDLLVPGQFGGDARRPDLACYRMRDGLLEIYELSENGGPLTKLAGRKVAAPLHALVAGRWGGRTDQLAAYDKFGGTLLFYGLRGTAIERVGASTGYQRRWEQLVGGNFDGDRRTDLLFYDSDTGLAKLMAVTPAWGLRTLHTVNDWPQAPCVRVLPVQLDGDRLTDLVVYDQRGGQDPTRQGQLRTYRMDLRRGPQLLATARWLSNTFIRMVSLRGGGAPELLAYASTRQIHLRCVRVADPSRTPNPPVNPANVGDADIRAWIATANRVYGAAGVHFVWDGTTHIIRHEKLNRYACRGGADPDAVRRATDYAGGYPHQLVVFFRRFEPDGKGGFRTAGSGCGSPRSPYMIMPGRDSQTRFYTSDGKPSALAFNVKLFAHELGHYFGLAHPFSDRCNDRFKTAGGGYKQRADFPSDAAARAWVRRRVADHLASLPAAHRNAAGLDADRSARGWTRVHDTSPEPGIGYWRVLGRDLAEHGRAGEIRVTLPGGKTVTVLPERHNVMSYFNVDRMWRLTPDQARAVRESLLGPRKRLIGRR